MFHLRCSLQRFSRGRQAWIGKDLGEKVDSVLDKPLYDV